jgi:putative tricarboxylic transport membrane protein
MGDSLTLLMGGFAAALQPENLLFAFAGCFLGTLVGVLPGIGPSATIAILLPATFALPPTASIIMLAAIYYGTQYGGTITSVLFNTPGEAASAITGVDGHAMARQGRAGAALTVAAIGSFIGGTVTTFALAFLGPPLGALALRFGPPEFFSLMVASLMLTASLSGQSLLRGMLSATIGLVLAMVGTDPVMGLPRLTFGEANLLDGIGFVVVIMGLFGVGEILANIEDPERRFAQAELTRLRMTREDWRRSAGPIARGTVFGFAIGVIPGLGSVSAAFMSYAMEKQISREPGRFGHGAIEGVAGPETANNAAANGALLPLLTLGIPGSGVVAILMGAFMMNGLVPGPLLFQEHGDVVWAVIASLYIGNVMLLVLNLPLIPIWLAVLRIPYPVLFALILGFTVVGTYSLSNSAFDLWLLAAFGVLGWLFRRLDIPLVPLTLTLILGPLMEGGLRRSLEMSQGDFMILLERPISAGCLALAALLLLHAAWSAWRAAPQPTVG